MTQFPIQEIEEDLAVDGEGSEDEDAYIRYDIATYPSDLTIQVLKDMWDSKDITIPNFQRNFVWTIKQSSALIESFLLGLPVPQAFFYIDDENKNLVIDGQQRITSLVYFIDGYFGDESLQGRKQVFRLTGLSEKSPFAKKRFVDLEEKDRRKFLGAVLRIVNIRQMMPRDSGTAAFHIFERLNTGGTPLKPQEIRNCVFHGGIVDKLNKMNSDKNWRKILGRKNIDKHQRDAEIILRIFAMYEGLERYEKPMKEFLNQAMKNNRTGETEDFQDFYQKFPDVCASIVSSLGEKPFHVRGPLNLAALDSFMANVARYKPSIDKLKSSYLSLMSDENYKEAIFFNTSDGAVIKNRMNKVRSMM